MNPVTRESAVGAADGCDSATAGCDHGGHFDAARFATRKSARARHSEQTGGITQLERWLLRRVLQGLGGPPIAVELWNGEAIATSAAPPATMLHIHDRRTLWKLLGDPRYQFGEAYVDGRLQIDGDLAEFLVSVNRSLLESGNFAFGVKGFAGWLHKPHRTTLAQARENVHHHYDIGNDFYRLWLDEQLLYTCAYFAEPTFSLEQAQVAKMDHVCRKIWLRPGETVIEAGCGWGGTGFAHGPQLRRARAGVQHLARADSLCAPLRRAEGLHDRVEFVEDDWRNIAGPCDVFVSVGMLEHVGRENYGELGT